MAKLIPLRNIPYRARRLESAARKVQGAGALEAASYRIDVAPGCHSRPYFDPPVVGWVCTREAATAIVAQTTKMPGNTTHRRMACGQI